jgi:hypothetical protein
VATPALPETKNSTIKRTKDYEKGVQIGYVPRSDNSIISRLMDAGKIILAKISKKEQVEGWLKISIDVYLHE